MNLVVIGAAAMVSIAAVVVLGFYLGQRALLYPAPRTYLAPAEMGLSGFAEDPLTAPDGTVVMVWSRKASPGMPTVLSFHGNGDSLPALAEEFDDWADAGWGVTAVSYRGYPGSGGRPSEAALIGDALAVFDRLVTRDGVPASEIVLFGFSLGSAVAMGVAAERSPAALYLVGAMSAIEDVAKAHYPLLPVHTLMKDRFRSADRAAHVTAPAFLVHGSDDRVVPIRFGKALYAALPEPKRFLEMPNAGHVVSFDAARTAFLSFADELGLAPRPGERGGS